jgi:hypothetical protein
MTNVFKRVLPGGSATKRVVTDFAEVAGLVYFGYVSQQSDEHHIVRGLTVSNKHRDDNYCIGTYEDYDVVFVERSDSIHGRHHVWHIMEFDLKTNTDIPHLFIGSGKHGQGFHELLATKFPDLKEMNPGVSVEYPASFTSGFKLYIRPAHAPEFEQLLSPANADIIGQHFKGLVAEITEQALYIYSEKTHLSLDLLNVMLKNGLWLARTIDINSRSLNGPAENDS